MAVITMFFGQLELEADSSLASFVGWVDYSQFVAPMAMQIFEGGQVELCKVGTV